MCLNEGCIPSKALLNSAKLYEHALHSAQYGVHCGEVRLDQQAVTVRRGRVVRTLHSGMLAPGEHVRVWDGGTADGRQVAAGMYFLSLRTSTGVHTQRVAVVR